MDNTKNENESKIENEPKTKWSFNPLKNVVGKFL